MYEWRTFLLVHVYKMIGCVFLTQNNDVGMREKAQINNAQKPLSCAYLAM